MVCVKSSLKCQSSPALSLSRARDAVSRSGIRLRAGDEWHFRLCEEVMSRKLSLERGRSKVKRTWSFFYNILFNNIFFSWEESVELARQKHEWTNTKTKGIKTNNYNLFSLSYALTCAGINRNPLSALEIPRQNQVMTRWSTSSWYWIFSENKNQSATCYHKDVGWVCYHCGIFGVSSQTSLDRRMNWVRK